MTKPVLCHYCRQIITTDPVEYRGEKYHPGECYEKAKPDSPQSF